MVSAPASAPQTLDQARIFALREAIARAGETFAEFRSGTGAGAATPPWDAVVLTCATESQAIAAREELSRRQALGLFPDHCLLLALSDPPRRRVGSGGATLLALEALATLWLRDAPAPATPAPAEPTGDAGLETLFQSRRVLLIHSGGESQRLPAYAALGKIFAPLPVLLPQATGSAIFDWLYLLASAIPGAPGEVTLLSGDVLPVFNPARIGRHGAAPLGVRGVALPVPAETGTQFGVYVPEAAPASRRAVRRPRRILQKPAREEMVAAGAVDVDGNVLVDTGMLTLGAPALRGLFAAAGVVARGDRVIRGESPLLPAAGGAAYWDLYRDWLPYLAPEIPPVPPDSSGVASRLAAAAASLDCTVAVPAEGVFIHLGTSRDFHDAVGRTSLLSTIFPFASQRDSAVESGAEIAGAFVGRSLLNRETRLLRGAVVDHCRSSGTLVLEAGATASGVEVAAGETLRVAAGRVCYQTLLVPENDDLSQEAAGHGNEVTSRPGNTPRRVTVVLGLDDNPKLTGDEAVFNGTPLHAWLAARGISPDDVWADGAPQTLWAARLFVGDAADPERRIFDWLQDDAPDRAPSEVREQWRSARRYSLRDLLDLSDAAAVAAWRGRLVGDIAAARIAADVAANGDTSFVELFSGLTPDQREEAQRQVTAAAEERGRTPDPLHRARLWRVLADLAAPEGTDEALREAYQDRAAAEVRVAVSRPVEGGSAQTGALPVGARARVGAPVRIDFGGGWTDTPPFSLERGGAVLNASITLDGALPIWAEAEVIDAPRVEIVAGDIDASTAITTHAHAAGFDNPDDPFALPKACLVLGGVIDPAPDRPLLRLPDGLGLRLHTSCRIPRGSGFGTSSIIGAAVLRALGEVLGRPQSDAELSRQTLELEQIMTTGGGWQDQMGAIAPGVKLVSTRSGLAQDPIVEPVRLSPAQLATLDAHLVVAYTGHHRLAKNILRQVVMRYLGRDPLAMQALYQLRMVAGQLARAAAALDLELFGTLVNQAWLLNKTLDPQTSYPAIERLFSALAPHIYGAKLVGAGGGGFMIAVTRQAHQQELIADLMARDREFAYGYVVQHQIWEGGLQVEHLA